jgi:glutamate-1-semialdehyde 2,1-aminomutase
MAAGLASLELVQEEGFYDLLFEKTRYLTNGLQNAANKAGVPFTTNSVGSMWGIFFTEAESVSNYQQVMSGNIDAFNRFFHGMLEQGVYIAPACYEAGFLSTSHSTDDLDATIDAALSVMNSL